jgi:hypothetical protein
LTLFFGFPASKWSPKDAQEYCGQGTFVEIFVSTYFNQIMFDQSHSRDLPFFVEMTGHDNGGRSSKFNCGFGAWPVFVKHIRVKIALRIFWRLF